MVLLTLAQLAALMASPTHPAPLQYIADKAITCTINQAPIINIVPQTKEIEYDGTKTSAQLTAVKSDTVSPYGLGVDTTTGGLRHDQPRMLLSITTNNIVNKKTQTFCMSYATITVGILLQPRIYLAKEFNSGQCGKMVLGHEKKHVTTDRWVMNKYSKQMGLAIQQLVNSSGVIGPLPVAQMEQAQTMMNQRIDNAIHATVEQMKQEMHIRQGHVDSLEEYERVNQYCIKEGEAAFKNLAQQ